MPKVFYTEDEYESLKYEKQQLERRLEAAEQLRPAWAMGFTNDSSAAQGYCAALTSIWEVLGVAHQTQCMKRIKELLAIEKQQHPSTTTLYAG
jgi:hypothetical protein